MLTKVMLTITLAASLIGCVSCRSSKPILLQQKVVEARAKRTHEAKEFSSGGTTEVTVVITGLVSLGEASSSAAPPPKVLYLIDAASLGGGLMAHVPIVMTDALYNPVPKGGRKLNSEGASARYVRLTNGEELSFEKANSTLSPLNYSEKPAIATCPTAAESDSLFFVPRLSRVGRKADGKPLSSADYDPTFLNPQAGGPVAAYLPINYGQLVSEFQTPLVWEFKDGATGKEATASQVLADKVIWKFKIPGDILTLNSNNSELLQMKAVDGEILLTIANAPDPDGIKVLAGTAMNIDLRKRPVDEHFGLYYQFLKDKSLTPFRPVVQGVCQNGKVVTDRCALANFVQISKSDKCPPPPPLVGGLNCGPDGMP